MTTIMKRIDLIKAGGFAPTENLFVTQVAPPEPTANQVLIQVKASAVNPVDWKMAEYGFFLPEKLPVALGCDVAGVVVKAPGDESLVGKNVVCYLGASKLGGHDVDRGAFGEYVVVDASVVQEIPSSLSFAQAATMPVGSMTATMLLNAVNLPSGSFVLVWGASSSVGFNAVQLALKRGLKPIAVASSKHKANLEALGIAGFVDYTKDDVQAVVKDICGDAKLNGAVDCIGAPATFSTCAKLVSELGDADTEKIVSTVNPAGLPEPPTGVKTVAVDLGSAMDISDQLKSVVKATLPLMVELKTQPVRSVKGPFVAETLQQGFQVSKDGVSGEKVVIEWSE